MENIHNKVYQEVHTVGSWIHNVIGDYGDSGNPWYTLHEWQLIKKEV